MPRVPAASQHDAQAYCNLCQWVYECWATHSNLFESFPNHFQEVGNVPFNEFLETGYGRCLGRLNEISHQYIILQIAKLHDPALQRGNENLSIDFFVKQEFWSEDELSTVEDLASELEHLHAQIDEVRNKVLAHNDRTVYVRGTPLGSFPQGEDERYFLALAQLCSLIWNKFPDDTWPNAARVFDFAKTEFAETRYPHRTKPDSYSTSSCAQIQSFPKPPARLDGTK